MVNKDDNQDEDDVDLMDPDSYQDPNQLDDIERDLPDGDAKQEE